MHTIDVKSAADWITDEFLNWQKESGERQTVTKFAAFLGVTRDVLNQWMNGRRTPSADSADLLSSKLGPGIYDVLGQPRPDPQLQYILQNWGKLSEEQRQTLYTLAAQDLAGLTVATVAQPKPRRKVRAGERGQSKPKG